MHFTAYIDESGTHRDSPHMIMAGHVARAGQWNVFDRKWRRVLKRNKLKYFHATEVRNRKGQCKGWTPQQVERLRKQALKALTPHPLFSFVCILKNDDYKMHYRGGEVPRKVQLDSQYGICFRICLSFLSDYVSRVVEDDVELSLILEDGHKNTGDALRLYKMFKDYAPAEEAERVISVTFQDKKKIYGLQAADFLAYSSFRMEQTNPDDFTQLPRQNAPEVLKRKNCIFRLPADEELLKRFKNGLLGVETARKDYWGSGGHPQLEVEEE